MPANSTVGYISQTTYNLFLSFYFSFSFSLTLPFLTVKQTERRRGEKSELLQKRFCNKEPEKNREGSLAESSTHPIPLLDSWLVW